jgi:hypothetical protein
VQDTARPCCEASHDRDRISRGCSKTGANGRANSAIVTAYAGSLLARRPSTSAKSGEQAWIDEEAQPAGLSGEIEFGCSIAARSTDSAEAGGMAFEEKPLSALQGGEEGAQARQRLGR